MFFQISKFGFVGGLVLILNQTEGSLSLGVAPGLGMLRSKLPGDLFCYTCVEWMTVLGLWAEASSGWDYFLLFLLSSTFFLYFLP